MFGQRFGQVGLKHNRWVSSTRLTMATLLEAAQAELAETGIRRADIDLEMAKQQKRLDDLAAQRKNKGRGRPTTTHASKVRDAESKIANLQRNILPTESAPYVPRTAIELIGSAAQHPQHHAAASSVPVGRPTSDAKRQRVEGEDDDDDADLTDDDDGEESSEFKQFYGVAPAQQAFNGDVANGYMKHELLRSEIVVYPDNLIASGCRNELIGLKLVSEMGGTYWFIEWLRNTHIHVYAMLDNN